MRYEDFASLMRTERSELSEQMLKEQFMLYNQEQNLCRHIARFIPHAIQANDALAEIRLQLNKSRIYGTKRAIGVIDTFIEKLHEEGLQEKFSAEIQGMMLVREEIINLLDYDVRENISNEVSNDN